MNYVKIYDNLIDRGKNRSISGYTEQHHIIPRCIGGLDNSENLVNLTPEEHYVAHQLLIRIYPNNVSLLKAAVMMIPNRPSNKLYGWLRRLHSESMSDIMSGDKNPQFGSKWIHSTTLKKSKRIDKNESVPEGWELGRVICWNKKLEKEKTDSCNVCGKLKPIHYKFCSHSCANAARETIFDRHLEQMINDYQNGMSIHKCLVSRGLCGTGKNFTSLKKMLESIRG